MGNNLTIWHGLLAFIFVGLVFFICVRTAHKKPDQGVAGWLLFFLITLGLAVLNITNAFYQIGTLEQPTLSANPLWLDNLIILLKALILIYMAVRLTTIYILATSQRKTTTPWAILLLWIGTAIPIFCFLLPFFMLASNAGITLSPKEIAHIASYACIGLPYAIVWTFYLLKSKRVKNTYTQT